MTVAKHLENWQPSAAQRAFRDAIAVAFGIEPHQLVGRSRKRPIVRARQAASWLLRRRWPSLSWPQVGVVLGGRDHSTVIYAAREAEAKFLRESEYRERCEQLLAGLPVAKWVPVDPAAIPRRTAPRVLDTSAQLEVRSGGWCDQCDALVGPERQAACRSLWCGFKGRSNGIAVAKPRIAA